MEEILASIRRIIADDQDRVLPARFSGASIRPVTPAEIPQQAFEAEEDESAEDLAEDDEDAAPGDAPLHELPASSDRAAEPAEEPGPPQAHASPEPAPRIPLESRQESPAPAQRIPFEAGQESPAPAGRDEPLVSPQAHAAAEQAFQRLSATAHPRSSLTMEEHVTEMLRPMLKAWLDENLPALVERLVEAEIERIRRGR
jgi:cell pole-organizing protein PopZ